MAKRISNKRRKVLELVEKERFYTLEEAVKLVRETSYVNFDASVEMSLLLNIDTRHADQQIRGAMVLPNGTGRTQKVLVVTQGAKEQEAKDAGADFVGGKEILEDIKGGHHRCNTRYDG